MIFPMAGIKDGAKVLAGVPEAGVGTGTIRNYHGSASSLGTQRSLLIIYRLHDQDHKAHSLLPNALSSPSPCCWTPSRPVLEPLFLFLVLKKVLILSTKFSSNLCPSVHFEEEEGTGWPGERQMAKEMAEQPCLRQVTKEMRCAMPNFQE